MLTPEQIESANTKQLNEWLREFRIPGRSKLNTKVKKRNALKAFVRDAQPPAAAKTPSPKAATPAKPPAKSKSKAKSKSGRFRNKSHCGQSPAADIRALAESMGIETKKSNGRWRTKSDLCLAILQHQDASPAASRPSSPAVPASVPEPAPVAAPEPAPVDRRAELMKQKATELRRMLSAEGIPTKGPKKILVELLLNLEQHGRCDPEQGQHCGGNNSCVADRGVCVSPESAPLFEKAQLMIGDRKIIGSKKAIAALEKALAISAPAAGAEPDQPKPEPEPDLDLDDEPALGLAPVPDLDFDDEPALGLAPVPDLDLDDEKKEETPQRPPEGAEIFAPEGEELDAVLQQLRLKQGRELGEFNEIKQQIVKCLGLI